jgi:hypothetical protein
MSQNSLFIFRNMVFLGSIQLLMLFGTLLAKIGQSCFNHGLGLEDYLECTILFGQFEISTASLLMFCGSLIFVAWKTSRQIIEQERNWHK